MNKFSAVGRITRDPEIRIAGETSVARFGLAINRKFKRDGEPDADFINCVAFGKLCDILDKYTHKGSQVGIVARVQTGSYTNKEGVKVYTTDFVIEELDLLDKKEGGDNQGSQHANGNDGFMSIPSDLDSEELPFN